GIDMLPPESGVPTIRRELTYGSTRGEILVAGRLGVWTEEADPSGGLDIDKVNAALAQLPKPLVTVGEVKAAKLYGGLVVETTLDPAEQPFLFDHKVETDLPWLPGVMGSEAMAQAASVLAPGYRVAGVEAQTNLGALKFHRNEPKTLRVTVQMMPDGNGDLLGHALVQSIFQPPKAELPPQIKDHFQGVVRLSQADVEKPTLDFVPPSVDDLPITAAEIYASFFHGPAYQVIERAGIDGARIVSLMADNLGPNAADANAQELTSPRLFEHLVQSAALWSLKTKGKMALPAGYAKATVYRSPQEADGRRLYAVVNTPNDGASYDAQLVDTDGNVYVTLAGYQTVSMS
ncbi:MAG: polyketide synthase dehydratase domain-containing protein, partial [Caldilineaceae bacterium]|nr:polyketide synthase dehydratase domain-containing protein [Caldilineaceae bacterium]